MLGNATPVWVPPCMFHAQTVGETTAQEHHILIKSWDEMGKQSHLFALHHVTPVHTLQELGEGSALAGHAEAESPQQGPLVSVQRLVGGQLQHSLWTHSSVGNVGSGRGAAIEHAIKSSTLLWCVQRLVGGAAAAQPVESWMSTRLRGPGFLLQWLGGGGLQDSLEKMFGRSDFRGLGVCFTASMCPCDQSCCQISGWVVCCMLA